MWSDPDDIENWAVSPRGAGWLFGGSVVREVKVQFTVNISWFTYYYSCLQVQSRQFTQPYRSGSSTSARRFQVHV